MKWFCRRVSLAILIGISAWPLSARAQTPPPATAPSTQPTDDVLESALAEGFGITEDRAIELEKQLHANPSDLQTRCTLLGYYFMNEYKLHEASQARDGLALWMIANEPAASITGRPFCRFDQIANPDGYAKARELWLKQVAKFSQSPKVLVNAAHFFQLAEPSEADTLLRQAMAVEPQNAGLPEELARAHMLAMGKATPADRQDLARKALAEFTQALSLTSDTSAKFYIETSLPKVAFEAGYPVNAKQYAVQLLADAEPFKNNWNYGNAIFEANSILGRIALASGDLPSAEKYLLAAGKTPGSPQLGSFGPNMTLAREMLKKGDKKTVLAFFEECSRFWLMGRQKLGDWAAVINNDGVPDFGPNMDY
jgi:hypothetical protein